MSAAHPVYWELVDFIAAGTTPETLIAFRPSDAVQGRVQELLSRKHQAALIQWVIAPRTASPAGQLGCNVPATMTSVEFPVAFRSQLALRERTYTAGVDH